MTDEAIRAFGILKNRFFDFEPEIAIVLGSGLGRLADQLEDSHALPYDLLPGFHRPTVEGHGGQFILGKLEGKSVLCMQGRAHLYEGADISAIQTMVRTCFLMGCKTWLATNAAGSLRSEVMPGSLVLIKDHINFQFSNPLVGVNDERFGSRFVSLEDAYDAKFRKHLFQLARELNIPLTDGVYVSVIGPSFETPAEINAYRILGADLVGMSTVPEVILARHCGMKVVGISVVTNLAAGMHPVNVTHAETLKGAEMGAEKLVKLVRAFVRTYSADQ